jgi:hypothetical protein
MQTNVLEATSLRQQSAVHNGQGVRDNSVPFLDSSIPLKDASHGDVVSYSVETIWRKAECFAILKDGSRAKLRDAWQFVGYTGHNPARRLLFRHNGLHIEVQLNSEQLIVAMEQKPTGKMFGAIKRMLTANGGSLIRALGGSHTYTAVDGSQVSLARNPV